MDSAEQAALSQKMEGGTAKYYNSRRLVNPGDESRNGGWQELLMVPNRHFDHQSVNSSYSSVLLPQALLDSGEFLICITVILSLRVLKTYQYSHNIQAREVKRKLMFGI